MPDPIKLTDYDGGLTNILSPQLTSGQWIMGEPDVVMPRPEVQMPFTPPYMEDPLLPGRNVFEHWITPDSPYYPGNEIGWGDIPGEPDHGDPPGPPAPDAPTEDPWWLTGDPPPGFGPEGWGSTLYPFTGEEAIYAVPPSMPPGWDDMWSELMGRARTPYEPSNIAMPQMPPEFQQLLDQMMGGLNVSPIQTPGISDQTQGIMGDLTGFWQQLMGDYQPIESPSVRSDYLNQLMDPMLASALNMLENPSVYDDELMGRALEFGESRLDERYGAASRGLESELASRGLSYGSVAGGALSDLETQHGRAWDDIMTQLLLDRAHTMAGDRQAAFGNALNLGGFEAGLTQADFQMLMQAEGQNAQIQNMLAGMGTNIGGLSLRGDELVQSGELQAQHLAQQLYGLNLGTAQGLTQYGGQFNQQQFANELNQAQFNNMMEQQGFGNLMNTMGLGFNTAMQFQGAQRGERDFMAGLQQNAYNDYLRAFGLNEQLLSGADQGWMNWLMGGMGMDPVMASIWQAAMGGLGQAGSNYADIASSYNQALMFAATLLPQLLSGNAPEGSEDWWDDFTEWLNGGGAEDGEIPPAPPPIDEPAPPDVEVDEDFLTDPTL